MLSPGLHPQPGFLAWGLETQAALSASVSSSEECSGADVRSWAHGADSASNPLRPSLALVQKRGGTDGTRSPLGPTSSQDSSSQSKGAFWGAMSQSVVLLGAGGGSNGLRCPQRAWEMPERGRVGGPGRLHDGPGLGCDCLQPL